MRKFVVRLLAAVSILVGVLTVGSSAQAATPLHVNPSTTHDHVRMHPSDWWPAG